MFLFRTGKGRRKSVYETSVKISYSINSNIMYVSQSRANAGRYLRTDGNKHERAIREKIRQKLSVLNNSSVNAGNSQDPKQFLRRIRIFRVLMPTVSDGRRSSLTRFVKTLSLVVKFTESTITIVILNIVCF